MSLFYSCSVALACHFCNPAVSILPLDAILLSLLVCKSKSCHSSQENSQLISYRFTLVKGKIVSELCIPTSNDPFQSGDGKSPEMLGGKWSMGGSLECSMFESTSVALSSSYSFPCTLRTTNIFLQSHFNSFASQYNILSSPGYLSFPPASTLSNIREQKKSTHKKQKQKTKQIKTSTVSMHVELPR